jgi:citrate synthase
VSAPRAFRAGLEDVVAAASGICYLDGARGVLAYRGYDIHDLAAEASFEEVCYLLWYGRLPRRAELGDLASELAGARALPEPILRLIRMLAGVPAMDALRTVVSALAAHDADLADQTPEGHRRSAVRLTARLASVVATWGRVAAGGAPVAPDPVLGHAAHFLYQLTGERPDATAARALDVALVLHADHELNASTFAARVAAATLSDLYSAVVAAIGTLKGPLHGGANAEVMRLLLAIGPDADPARAEAVVRAKLGRKERIPGFGHRVYRTEDPRATALRRLARELGERRGEPGWYALAERIAQVVKAERALDPNVDFYSALVYRALGIPLDLFTPVFAVGRVAGWTAHVLEQYANNRLIRPRAEYVGPAYPQRFVPLASR